MAVRGYDHLAGDDGDEYNNRVVALLELRWGRLISWEDYEDTERIAAWDLHRRRTAERRGNVASVGDRGRR